MKKLNCYFAMILVFLAAGVCASGGPLSGTVTGVLTRSGSPYQVIGNIVLPSVERLTIEEGVTLDFQGHYYFDIDGEITVAGTETNPVLFTATNHTTGWAGIRIIGNWNDNIFNNAVFEYGRACAAYNPPYHGADMEGAGMYVEDARVTVQGCEFRHNKSTVHGTFSTFGPQEVRVYGSRFFWNETLNDCAGGGAVCLVFSSASDANIEVVGCEIAYNVAMDEAAGIGCYGPSQLAEGGKVLIANNLFYSNTCYGKWAPGSSAVGLFSGSCRVINNVFYGNVIADGASGQKCQIAVYEDSVDIRNNIIWNGTGHDSVFTIGSGSPTIQYNCIQGGYAGTGNISTDPMFTDAAGGDFTLRDGSPCIDTGTTNGLVLPETDFLGHPRVAGSSVDMGAFEYDVLSTYVFAVAGNPGNYGTPLPYGYGIQEVTKGTVLTNLVSNPAPVGGTRYVCTGWSGSGSVPTNGTGTNVVVTVNTNSTLTWQWLTEYYLDTTAGSHGSIDVGDGWHTNGAQVAITAAPDYGYRLLAWNGDVPVGMETDNPLTVTMDRPRVINAVFATNTGGMVESTISATSDDAEQWYDGTVQLVSSDLELTYNVKVEKQNQIVGLRFNGIAVPQGTTIRSAYIQFVARNDESDPCSVTVRVEQVDNAVTYVDTANNLSSRNVTTTSVRWDPPAWRGDDSGSPQRTADLKDLVQEVVNRSGWNDGNSLSFILRGAGTRTGMSFDGDETRSPVLHIEWGWGGFAAPTIANSGGGSLSSTSATLTGDLLSSGGAATMVWIYWGSSDGGTNQLAWANSINMGEVSEGVFSAGISGLTPNSVYYYRTYAMNSVGGVWAANTVPFATLTGGDVTNGLALHWKFDDGAGTIAVDSSGNGNTGALVNKSDSSWIGGQFGSALSFNGGSQYVFNSNLAQALSGDMTVSCWVRYTTTAGAALDLTDSGSAGLQIREDGTLGRLGWVNSGGPSTALYTTWSLHLDGRWHHVAYVREGTTYRMYVDNRFVGECGGTVVGYTKLFAGKNSAGTYWVGKMDDLRIYNRALTWGEVGSLKAGEGMGYVDADGDGMADVWEVQYFDSTNAVNGAAGYDGDGDGYSNLEEYMLGSDPTQASSAFRLFVTLNGHDTVVSYPTIEASGSAYSGKIRYYDLQSTANLLTGPWGNVAGAIDITGNNTVVAYTNLFPDAVRMFRVKVRLQ